MFAFSPMPHADAVKRIAGLPVVSREVMDGLLPELKAYAFTVTGLDSFDQLAKVKDMIKAVPAGAQTWAKARKEIATELADDLGGKVAQRRAELLLRTHVFRGYAVSRYRNLMQQIDVFPYWQYRTHGDGNVRPSHAALNGKIFPAGHPIWQRIFPPWDWGCRCIIVPLTRAAVEAIKRKPVVSDDAARDILLPTQLAVAEVYDTHMADMILKAERLPNGIPLNRTPTFSDSPWSEPGSVHHDWKLIEARYSNDPDTLKAFKGWAEKTEISPGVMVGDWLSDGAATKARTKLPKKAKAAAPEKKPTVGTYAQDVQAMLVQAGNAKAKVDFRTASLEAAQAMSESVSDHLRDFPRLADRLDFIGTSAAQTEYVKERFQAEADKWASDYWDKSGFPQDVIDRRKREMIDKYLRKRITRSPKASAFYSPRGAGKDILVMNKKGGNPVAADLNAITRSIESGWWPKNIKGTPAAKHITTHELGHAMDALLDLRTMPEMQSIWRQKMAALTRAQAADQLSIYGTTNIQEMIAEAWTEYRHAPNPRPLAREIGDLITQRYQTRFPS